MFTYNNIITLFDRIATAHNQIESFGTGELWEVDATIKPGFKYPLLWVAPISSITKDQVQERTFNVLVMAQVDKGKVYEQEVLSDCELILNDVIKVLKNENDYYELIGEPSLIPFKEDFGDWLTGWRSELVILSDMNGNACDVPIEVFISPNNL
jgi:hypothetical protein